MPSFDKILIQRGIISPEQLQEADRLASEKGEKSKTA